MSESQVVVGIDVAKAHVDCAVLGADFGARQFANDIDGHSALARPCSHFRSPWW
jgi:transposase